jgi:hypothetical protein
MGNRYIKSQCHMAMGVRGSTRGLDSIKQSTMKHNAAMKQTMNIGRERRSAMGPPTFLKNY